MTRLVIYTALGACSLLVSYCYLSTQCFSRRHFWCDPSTRNVALAQQPHDGFHVAESSSAGISGSQYDPAACNIKSGHLSFSVRPISFSIPKEVISERVLRRKTRNFASIIPGRPETYTFQNQHDYYEGYQVSRFGITFKKAGWDCLRHLEIVASGCMPYLIDAHMIPEGTMFRWPKHILSSVLHLEGINHASIRELSSGGENVLDASLINEKEFDIPKYNFLLGNIQDHARRHLTTEAMAEYVFAISNVDIKAAKILYVGSPQHETNYPDYMACTLFHGMRSILGSRVVDVPKREWMYAGFAIDQVYEGGSRTQAF